MDQLKINASEEFYRLYNREEFKHKLDFKLVDQDRVSATRYLTTGRSKRWLI